jgi:hypothetical protein
MTMATVFAVYQCVDEGKLKPGSRSEVQEQRRAVNRQDYVSEIPRASSHDTMKHITVLAVNRGKQQDMD